MKLFPDITNTYIRRVYLFLLLSDIRIIYFMNIIISIITITCIIIIIIIIIIHIFSILM